MRSRTVSSRTERVLTCGVTTTTATVLRRRAGRCGSSWEHPTSQYATLNLLVSGLPVMPAHAKFGATDTASPPAEIAKVALGDGAGTGTPTLAGVAGERGRAVPTAGRCSGVTVRPDGWPWLPVRRRTTPAAADRLPAPTKGSGTWRCTPSPSLSPCRVDGGFEPGNLTPHRSSTPPARLDQAETRGTGRGQGIRRSFIKPRSCARQGSQAVIRSPMARVGPQPDSAPLTRRMPAWSVRQGPAGGSHSPIVDTSPTWLNGGASAIRSAAVDRRGDHNVRTLTEHTDRRAVVAPGTLPLGWVDPSTCSLGLGHD
ncbi:hypothetical protein EV193_113118 [Herbihabitans rhizosphaerae]|uniref:Uncharacterized protein n=1 Tax=Herbihabitans rhizosphaerae TaxID=1872711 RepID=A0A4Q7KDI1_9PSEU|nr:hypothetical protein EV193_113118 [Herbihabitans rhizosphaerae]